MPCNANKLPHSTKAKHQVDACCHVSGKNLQLPSLQLVYISHIPHIHFLHLGTASSNHANKTPPPPAKPELPLVAHSGKFRVSMHGLRVSAGTGPCSNQATTGVKSRSPLHRIQGRTTNHGFGLFKGDLAKPFRRFGAWL